MSEVGLPADDLRHQLRAGGDWSRQGDAAETQVVGGRPAEPRTVPEVLLAVYRVLEERGYDPVGQLAQYLMSGEPTYITAHRGARVLITRVERDEILTEIVRAYLAGPPPRQ